MRLGLIALLLLCWTAAAHAQEAAISPHVEKFTLPNGMRFLVVPRHDVPTFSAQLEFRVGSSDEFPGIAGGSHMLEHMMFKGTTNVGTWNYAAEVPLMKQIDKLAADMIEEQKKMSTAFGGGDAKKVAALKEQIRKLQEQQKQYMLSEELWGIYTRNGAEGLNASTGEDTTSYHLSLPANRLEVWAYLESDRMAHPVFREFYTERDVVMEERRSSVDNNPEGKMFEALQAVAYASSPYHWPTLGWPSDLESMRREDMENYFRVHYAPNNAVASIVGDVTVEQVKAMALKYFAAIPPHALPESVPTREIEPYGERRIAVEADSHPIIWEAYMGPRYGDPDEYALDLAAEVLSRGRTSRLYKTLVEEKRLATSAFASNYTRRLGNLFLIGAEPLGSHTTVELEDALNQQLEQLKTRPVDKAELDKVLTGLEADFVRGLRSNMGLASRLAASEIETGDWHNFDERPRWRAVTTQQIMEAAKHYFTAKNRTVATLVQTKAGGK